MRSHRWVVTISCWQRRRRGPARNYECTYESIAQRSSVALLRAVNQWTRDTGKRVGRRTRLTIRIQSFPLP